MGVAGYSEMARMLGLNDVADKYALIAQEMAMKWEKMANEGDHYRLAFDRKNTWSQKYNMVWDKLWNLNLFPNNVIEKELNYYLTKQNLYGLPFGFPQRIHQIRLDHVDGSYVIRQGNFPEIL